MNATEIEDLSKSVCFETLKKYRDEVGKRTTEIIKTLMPATRHIFVHLNESLRITEKSKKNL